MELFILLSWLVLATAESSYNMNHIESLLQQKKLALKKRFRPIYHISAPFGWLNSPSAFVYFKKKYHIFYQYHPYNGAWGNVHWGHVISNNLVDWVHYPTALTPKEHYEKQGCMAGSAIIHNSYLTLFYTGNVLFTNDSHNTQNAAISADGLIFQKYLYNPVVRIVQDDLAEVKNPKVWRARNLWYMLLGSSTKNRLGQLLLYTSNDSLNWKLKATLAESYGDMGYVWENPDLVELSGQQVLLLSVQGIQVDGYRFKNFYQNGYVVGKFNYHTSEFEDMEISVATFHELDHGHDFYNAKTMYAPDGRVLLVAWLGMAESEMEESVDGWAGMLTLVRELKLNQYGRVFMTPVREIILLRSEILEDAWYNPGEMFLAGAKAFEMVVNSSTVNADAGIILEWGGDEQRYMISYFSDQAFMSVYRGGEDGERRADWKPISRVHWRIFVDTSSIEVFCGAGEVVFSSRIYPRRPMWVRISGQVQLHITQYKLRRSLG